MPETHHYRTYWPITNTMKVILGLPCRVRVTGMENFPREGAVIMASNHISHFDPPLLSGAMRRPIDWMAMEEMFVNPLSAKLFLNAGCIPTNRHEGDKTSLRTALKRLKAGRVIGIFPEGGLRAGSASLLEGAPFRQGATALSMLARTPIAPCVLIGSDRLYTHRNWLRPKGTTICIGVGPVIHPPTEKEARDSYQQQLAAAFLALKERVIGEFGLKPDDLPQTPQRRKGREP